MTNVESRLANLQSRIRIRHMHLDRISELLHPFLEDSNDRSQPAPKGLTAGDLRHISIYIDILQRWNARINLTAIR